jgi:hypothetical protein
MAGVHMQRRYGMLDALAFTAGSFAPLVTRGQQLYSARCWPLSLQSAAVSITSCASAVFSLSCIRSLALPA